MVRKPACSPVPILSPLAAWLHACLTSTSGHTAASTKFPFQPLYLVVSVAAGFLRLLFLHTRGVLSCLHFLIAPLSLIDLTDPNPCITPLIFNF